MTARAWERTFAFDVQEKKGPLIQTLTGAEQERVELIVPEDAYVHRCAFTPTGHFDEEDEE